MGKMKLIVEPQCMGFEHAQVNTAFLDLFKQSFPEEKILFLGEKTQIAEINTVKNIEIDKRIIEIPPRKSSGYRRLIQEYKMMKIIFNVATQEGYSQIIFLSITSEGLWALKYFAKKYSNINITCIPHTILESIIRRPSIKRIWNFPFWFRLPFLYFNFSNLKYLLLGDYIKEYIAEKFPKMKNHVNSMHLPYYYNENNETHLKYRNGKIKFGFIGVAHKNKGAHLFFELAKYICDEKKLNAEFYLIGHIVDKRINKYKNEYVKICGEKPIDQSEYNRLISEMDYTVFLYNQNSYKLIASGAVLDAFSHVKPILCLKNNMFDDYFSKFGNIGVCADNFENLKIKMEASIHNFNESKYDEMIKNIFEMREKIEIKSLVINIKKILEFRNEDI